MKAVCVATGLVVCLLSQASLAGLTVDIDPPIGAVAEATVGSPLLTELQLIEVSERRVANRDPSAPATLIEPLSMAIGGGNVTVAAGKQLIPHPDVFDGRYGYAAYDHFVSAKGKRSAAVLLDRNDDQTFDELWVNAGGTWRPEWVSASITPALRYQEAPEVSVSVTPGSNTENFRRELLYLGFSKGVLRIQYREYADRMARQAFYQELAYDIAQFPTTVSFRNYRLEILQADNNGIRYRVLEVR